MTLPRLLERYALLLVGTMAVGLAGPARAEWPEQTRTDEAALTGRMGPITPPPGFWGDPYATPGVLITHDVAPYAVQRQLTAAGPGGDVFVAGPWVHTFRDPSGNVLFSSSLNFVNLFVARYDEFGGFQEAWQVRAQTADLLLDDLEIDERGRVWMAGRFRGDVDFLGDDGQLKALQAPDNGRCQIEPGCRSQYAFVAALDPGQLGLPAKWDLAVHRGGEDTLYNDSRLASDVDLHAFPGKGTYIQGAAVRLARGAPAGGAGQDFYLGVNFKSLRKEGSPFFFTIFHLKNDGTSVLPGDRVDYHPTFGGEGDDNAAADNWVLDDLEYAGGDLYFTFHRPDYALGDPHEAEEFCWPDLFTCEGGLEDGNPCEPDLLYSTSYIDGSSNATTPAGQILQSCGEAQPRISGFSCALLGGQCKRDETVGAAYSWLGRDQPPEDDSRRAVKADRLDWISGFWELDWFVGPAPDQGWCSGNTGVSCIQDGDCSGLGLGSCVLDDFDEPFSGVFCPETSNAAGGWRGDGALGTPTVFTGGQTYGDQTYGGLPSCFFGRWTDIVIPESFNNDRVFWLVGIGDSVNQNGQPTTAGGAADRFWLGANPSVSVQNNPIARDDTYLAKVNADACPSGSGPDCGETPWLAVDWISDAALFVEPAWFDFSYLPSGAVDSSGDVYVAAPVRGSADYSAGDCRTAVECSQAADEACSDFSLPDQCAFDGVPKVVVAGADTSGAFQWGVDAKSTAPEGGVMPTGLAVLETADESGANTFTTVLASGFFQKGWTQGDRTLSGDLAGWVGAVDVLGAFSDWQSFDEWTVGVSIPSPTPDWNGCPPDASGSGDPGAGADAADLFHFTCTAAAVDGLCSCGENEVFPVAPIQGARLLWHERKFCSGNPSQGCLVDQDCSTLGFGDCNLGGTVARSLASASYPSARSTFGACTPEQDCVQLHLTGAPVDLQAGAGTLTTYPGAGGAIAQGSDLSPVPNFFDINVPDAGTVVDLDVELDVTHPSLSDLKIWLNDPDGNRTLIVGGVSGADLATTLDADADAWISGQTGPAFGTFRPYGPLPLPSTSQGLWRLEIYDNFDFGSTGSVTSWGLRLRVGGDTFVEVASAENEPDPASLESAGVFRRDTTGHTVFRYAGASGTHFLVTDTVGLGEWPTPPLAASTLAYGQECVVGTPLDPRLLYVVPFGGSLLLPIPVPLNSAGPGALVGGGGHVVGAMAPVDASGPDAAYNPLTASGPILPVNTRLPSGNPASLAVSYYRRGAGGVHWPTRPVVWSQCRWPSDPDRIVIDELVGSGYCDAAGCQPDLDAVSFPQARLYVQSDPAKPGFNPNDEHAFLGSGLDASFDTATVAFHASRLWTATNGSFSVVAASSVDPACQSPAIAGSHAVESTIDTAFDNIIPGEFGSGATVRLTGTGDADGDGRPDLDGDYGWGGTCKASGKAWVGLVPRTGSPPLQTACYNASGGGCELRRLTVSVQNPAHLVRVGGSAPGWDADFGRFDRIRVRNSGLPVLDGDGVDTGKNKNDGTYSIEGVDADRIDLVSPWPAGLAQETTVSDPLLTGSPVEDEAIPGGTANVLLSATGDPTAVRAAYALREQPRGTGASDPYVLLKYRDPGSGSWAMKVYDVRETVSGGAFEFDVRVGDPIDPPNPLPNLGGCAETVLEPRKGDPGWKDKKGNVWARSDGRLEASYYYPLRPDFWQDDDGDGVNDNDGTGRCVPWLPRTGGSRPVTYTSRWPDAFPLLQVGQTLLESRPSINGNLLPDITNQAAVQVIFQGDEGNGLAPEDPAWEPSQPFTDPGISFGPGYNAAVFGVDSEDPIRLVKLLDPFTTRWVDAPGFPTTLLDDAPWELSQRLDHDLVNGRLGFHGFRIDLAQGEDPLLPNVMTPEERDLLEGLCGSDSGCKSSVQALFEKTRDPLGLAPDILTGDLAEDVLLGVQVDATGNALEPIDLAGGELALSAGAARGEGWVTLALGDDGSDNPVTVTAIKVGCPYYTGSVYRLPPRGTSVSPFAETARFRHTGDFGGELGGSSPRFTFEWQWQPDAVDRDASDSPASCAGATCFAELVGETRSDAAVGPDTSGPSFLEDNFLVARYLDGEMPAGLAGTVCAQPEDPPQSPGYPAWTSYWSGAPGGTATNPRAQLAEGWVKRVLDDLNPFEQRVSAFHTTPAATYVSMVEQAGPPFRGEIAFNPDPDNLNGVGLIETYRTVLNRAVRLTIDAPTPRSTDASNTALLLAASKAADLYMLLGNEAFNDSVDPTIGFTTKSGDFLTLASSIFAFQDQLVSPLDEELALLRGIDDSSGPVNVEPTFNRLVWNFSRGNGEVAYTQVYGIGDRDGSGSITETDAAIAFPQGHGDAWGHYLSAIQGYYRLLHDSQFRWIPRAESIDIGGVPQIVDYQDERKFARAAAARARAGRDILDLTYREAYVDDPAGQWQGYKDTDPQRGWGVDEWAGRAATGAYLDWVMGNALLPDVWTAPGARPCDPDLFGAACPDLSGTCSAGTNTGSACSTDADCDPDPDLGSCDPDPGSFPDIGKIDRTNVEELAELGPVAGEIQGRMDEVDAGLNPLGLPKGAVPFDIDPSLLTPALGSNAKTHFQQVYDRALRALRNTVTAFDHANEISRSLRQNEDTLTAFTSNVSGQERDLRNRLIEIFGHAYPDDIADPTSPNFGNTGGPDLYRYMYVENALPGLGDAETIQTKFKPIPNIGFYPGDTSGDTADRFTTFSYESQGPGLRKPAEWTGRREAIGDLQRMLSSVYRNQLALEQTRLDFDNLLATVKRKAALVQQRHGVRAAEITARTALAATTTTLNAMILSFETVSKNLDSLADTYGDFADALAESLPKSVGLSFDATSVARGALKNVGAQVKSGLKRASVGLEIQSLGLNFAKEEAALATDLVLVGLNASVEFQSDLNDLEDLTQDLAIKQLAAMNQAEVLDQSIADYWSKLAEGLRTLDQLASFRATTAGNVQQFRYQDLAFRIALNDALQKYRAQFDMAARYAYLAAAAYDYETNLLGSDSGSGREFLTDIVKERSLGQVVDGEPIIGTGGIADTLARMNANFEVLESQLGFNNPQVETNRFSLRAELLRILRQEDPESTASDDKLWKRALKKYRVANLWDLPEFRQLARPFGPEPAPCTADGCETEPALVIGWEGKGGPSLSTTVTSGLNFFGKKLSGGDSTYDPTRFATKIRAVGVWFENYDGNGLSNTPRVYLLPVGADVLRPPTSGDFATREWTVADQTLPVPFPIGAQDLADPDWIPLNDTTTVDLGDVRRFGRIRAYHDSGNFDPSETVTDTRLVGRSVWNTRWLLVIPGETLRFDKSAGLRDFIQNVSDIKIFFETYSYEGN